MKYIGVFLVLALCAGVPVFAQDAANLPLVGVLRINTPDTVEPMATLFGTALAALGWVDGRTIRLESRLSGGHVDRFPELAQALDTENARVIVALGDSAIRAAQQATRSIPIVAIADDLVASGLISSLARPGGNTTGVSILATALDAKKLEILKRIVPGARRFGVLSDPANTASARLRAIADRARTLGVELQIVQVHGAADIVPAFASFRAEGAEAVDILASPLLNGLRNELGPLSLDYKASRDLPISRGGRGGMPGELWRQIVGRLCHGRGVDRQDAEGGGARRHASRTADQVRAGNQPKARRERSASRSRPRSLTAPMR